MTDKAFHDFLAAFDEKTRQKSSRETREEQLARKKRDALEPIALLLERLSKLGLIVEDTRSAARTPGFAQGMEAEFRVTEGPSAPSWAPGVSLFIDHPAEIEIAVPNESDIVEKGPVVISCATQHPDRGMLIKKHLSVHAAADALARFLAKNTLRIKNDPRSPEARAAASASRAEPAQEVLPPTPAPALASAPEESAFSTLATPVVAPITPISAPVSAPLPKAADIAGQATRPAPASAAASQGGKASGSAAAAKTAPAATPAARVGQSPVGARLAGGPKPPAGATPPRARAPAPPAEPRAASDAPADE